jgi:hypothetical protein
MDAKRNGIEDRGGEAAGPVVSLRLTDSSEVHRPLRDVRASQIAEAVPWRRARSARGQAHYPGYYWSVTTGSHVVYESRLELARLLIADFDPDVVAIAAQPFLLKARIGGHMRRHVPDIFLVRADQSAQLVNVKPGRLLADPKVAEALAWPGQLAVAHGWAYEIWSGDNPVYLANLRFLAGYRRPWLVPDGLAGEVLAAVRPGDTVATLTGALARITLPGRSRWRRCCCPCRARGSRRGHRGSGSAPGSPRP